MTAFPDDPPSVAREVIPLRERPLDLALIAFFLVNILFVTYVVDAEQLIIPDTSHFTYPLWPPRAMVDLFHWYGRTYDPLLMARPPFWKATIWIDVLLFGPFYLCAVYAFAKGREWIRIPTIIWGTALITNVVIIMGEEFFGRFATPHPAMVVGSNAPWVIVPLYLIQRMWREAHPFTRRRAA